MLYDSGFLDGGFFCPGEAGGNCGFGRAAGGRDEEQKRNQRLKIKEQNYRAKFKMKIRKTRIVELNRRQDKL